MTRTLQDAQPTDVPQCAQAVHAEACRNTAGPRLMEWVKVD